MPLSGQELANNHVNQAASKLFLGIAQGKFLNVWTLMKDHVESFATAC